MKPSDSMLEESKAVLQEIIEQLEALKPVVGAESYHGGDDIQSALYDLEDALCEVEYCIDRRICPN